MKHSNIKSIAIIAGLTLLFTGCMGGLEDAFNVNNKHTIAPVEKLEVPDRLISSYCLKNSENVEYGYVFESKEQLPTLYGHNSKEIFEWPEIDFEKYSVVFAFAYYIPNRNIGEHRLVIKGGEPKFYIQMTIMSPVYSLCDINTYCIAELYPKLNYEGKMEVIKYETIGYE